MSPTALNPVALMSKAETACTSAQTLLALGDVDGATNRAYYAMFDAARAALLANADRSSAAEPISRTHGGMIAAFGSAFVKTGLMPKELGRLLNRAHEIRLVADYTGASVELTDARAMVEQAVIFVTAIRSTFLQR